MTGRRELMLGLGAALALTGAARLPPPRVALFDLAIAGGWYHGLRRAVPHLAVGTALVLRPEPANPHDPNAVEVLMPRGAPLAGLKLGYVPRAAAPVVAGLLARGVGLGVTVAGRLRWPVDGDARALVFTGFSDGDPRLALTLDG
jgi:hypothetical protein